MAKIKDSEPKSSSGGYDRVLGNKDISRLIQKIQSTVIRNGDELEKIITEKHTQKIDNLDHFIVERNSLTDGVYLCPKRIIKQSKKYSLPGHEPDFLIFTLDKDDPECPKCCVIELKDGDNFDTKKSTSEFESLKKYSDFIGSKTPFTPEYKICCFNQCEKEKIIEGLKNRFKSNEVLTGLEFCTIIDLDYAEIVNSRKKDIKDNMDYFAEKIISVIEIREKLIAKLKKVVNKEDFY